jgi:hypothetical protein
VTPATTPGDLLVGRLRTDPGGPLLTFYDDATGERTELSAATFANWVAKSANLLADELGVGPGNRVALRLPAHWQTVVALHAIWRVGALAGTGELPAADVLVCDEQSLPSLPATCPVAARCPVSWTRQRRWRHSRTPARCRPRRVTPRHWSAPEVRRCPRRPWSPQPRRPPAGSCWSPIAGTPRNSCWPPR